jgi:hypothetical protein
LDVDHVLAFAGAVSESLLGVGGHAKPVDGDVIADGRARRHAIEYA